MSSASFSPSSAPPRWTERLQPWAAALVSALLHLLVLLLLLHSTPPVVTTPQGTAGGGRVKVDFVGEAPPSPTPARQPPGPKQDDARKKPARPTARRHADARKPVPEARYIEPPAEPEQRQARSEEPPAPEPTQAAATQPPESVQRRPQTWTGRPPGWQPRDTAPDDGRSSGPVNRNGYRNDMAAGEPAMEVGGYQIVYDLLGEARLRGWMEQGVKELSIPLPGTTYLMVCPAEVALRRGSSKCRLLPPDAPELQSIGDARQVVTVMYVYRRGELVWRGPGPYR
ncbi:MAG: hypothetical protein ABS96_33885 [Lysobacteraceae bacterium SCN 69-123]|jgi:hypothetical protein|uniref:type II toxin-antitoxin system RelE/ParE family toxin n=1 Tax=Stenotrophomonas acidaminiphila TaxID=128780 RepID=UPI00086A3F1F|nr:type II toxin-antitoxin system RelE/ParE family toxin [Stenotrophomonas acidaminiphila]MBN8802118.1 type II toxin-antitoxin system RelE/ParE family toxin [Stenotrophomonas acidaminiphila]MDF9442793.1 type II toxin-antitoxin system RelE/ParE family toxin [Stenotrophomonas acidaminiphila]ODU40894.1 MAG: hypothetical protein ABS96_33885 [Xanthomonadaceae bacterium SCN 69-123]OJY78121.1 MAG: hypothetical protein BGP18_04675 [Stenotrophomonas sp. 69-14]